MLSGHSARRDRVVQIKLYLYLIVPDCCERRTFRLSHSAMKSASLFKPSKSRSCVQDVVRTCKLNHSHDEAVGAFDKLGEVVGAPSGRLAMGKLTSFSPDSTKMVSFLPPGVGSPRFVAKHTVAFR